MRFGLLFVIYIVIGLLVAGGVIGSEANYFSGLNSLEDILNMVLAVLLWPLVLLGVNFNIGTGGSSGGSSGASSAQGGAGGGGK